MQKIGDRLQRRRLAGAIGPEKRDDAAARHRKRHAFEHENDPVVDHLDIVKRENWAPVCGRGRFGFVAATMVMAQCSLRSPVRDLRDFPAVMGPGQQSARARRCGACTPHRVRETKGFQFRLRGLFARLGPLRPTGVCLHVVLSGAVDQRQHLVLDRLDRRHLRVPLGPVPLDQRDAAVAIMIGAAQVDR